MPHTRGDGMQEQWPTGDCLHMPVRLDQTNEDVPPVVKQRDEARGRADRAATPFRADGTGTFRVIEEPRLSQLLHQRLADDGRLVADRPPELRTPPMDPGD